MGHSKMLRYRLLLEPMSTVSFAASLNAQFAVHRKHNFSFLEKILTQSQMYLFT